jgi:heme-degrading monooxygenase HmoA
MDENLPAPRDHAQAYALTFPGAYKEHPWGETVVKVNKKVFRRSGQATKGTGMIHQLRIYEIFEQNKAAFHARFRDHAARLMRGYGFTIVAMWESRSEERTEFVYLLAWPDEATMRQAWAAFLADAEWVEIKRVTREQHGDLVGVISDRVLHPLGEAPALAASPQAGETSDQ